MINTVYDTNILVSSFIGKGPPQAADWIDMLLLFSFLITCSLGIIINRTVKNSAPSAITINKTFISIELHLLYR